MVSALAADAGLGAGAIVLKSLAQDAPPEGIAVSEGPAAELSPASMIKVPIALVLAESWAEGTHRPGETVEIGAENQTPNDLPSPFVPGYRATLEELGRLMLTRSDNVATNVLIDVLGRDSITGRCRAWGLQATAVRRKLSGALPLIDDPGATGRNAHPATDAALLFERIARARERDGGWLLRTLHAQEWNDKLSAGLRPGDRFAHKTGETSEVSHDGGILELHGGARWIVVVYTALAPGAENETRFAHFMRALRPHLG